MATENAKAVAKELAGTPLTPNFTSKDYGIFFTAGALCCTLWVIQHLYCILPYSNITFRSHGGMTRECLAWHILLSSSCQEFW